MNREEALKEIIQVIDERNREGTLYTDSKTISHINRIIKEMI